MSLNNSDINGVYEYLSYMETNGKGDLSYPELEVNFGISPYKELGNRAKKLWQRYKKSNLSIVDYMTKKLGIGETNIFNESEVGNPEHISERKEWQYTNTGETAYFKGTTEHCVTNEKEALKFCKVDQTEWEIKDWRFKSWDVTMRVKTPIDVNGTIVMKTSAIKRTNYGVQLWFTRISQNKKGFDELLTSAEEANQ